MPTEPTPLQFDNAEYGGGGAAAPTGIACAACKRSIVDQYFEAVSKVFCSNCAAVIKAGPKGGSRIWRTIEALLSGLIGGTIGAVIYFLVLKFTGYTVGLIAILVGVLVGGGVRRGSRGRGGLFYQLMAVVLTYCAITSTYVPMMVEGINGEAVRNHERLTGSGAESVKISVMADNRVLLNGVDATREQWNAELDRMKEKGGFVSYYREGRMEGAPPTAISNEVHAAIFDRGLERASFKDSGFTIPLYDTLDSPGATPIERFVMYSSLWVFALTLPFSMIKELPISFLILMFALVQAWAINKKPKIAIAGPFVISPGAMGQGSIVHVPPRSGGAAVLSDPFASPPVPGDPPQRPVSP